MKNLFALATLILLVTSFLVPALSHSQPASAAASDDVTDFNGDGYEDLAIGVYSEDIGAAANTGAVNVIYGSASGLSAAAIPDQIWTQNSASIDDASEIGDSFGQSLTSGDFNGDGRDDLAIGVQFEDLSNATNAGAVNVIYGSSLGLKATPVSAGNGRADQIFTQDSANIEGVAEDSDEFGKSLTSGDFNGDSFDDLAIGVPNQDVDGFENAGAVSVIYGSASGLSATAIPDQIWTQNSPDVEDNSEAFDRIGISLEAGDFNGDGTDDLVIGAPEEDEGSRSLTGAVAVIYGSPSGLSVASIGDQVWTQDSGNIEGVAETNDLFGGALAVGDFNADGFDDLAIGVSDEDEGTTSNTRNTGAVNVIYGSSFGLRATTLSPPVGKDPGDGHADQVWTQNSPDVEDTSEGSDRFGYSLAAGDFNNDGRDDLAIGVPDEDDGNSFNTGAVNVIYGSTGGGLQPTAFSTGNGRADQMWSQNSNNIEEIAEVDDKFGYSLAAADFNGDGRDDLAIGVPFEDLDSISDAGAVNVIYGVAGTTFLNSGLGATVPAGGSGRSDQLWSQESPGIEETADGDDAFGRSLKRGHFGDGEF